MSAQPASAAITAPTADIEYGRLARSSRSDAPLEVTSSTAFIAFVHKENAAAFPELHAYLGRKALARLSHESLSV